MKNILFILTLSLLLTVKSTAEIPSAPTRTELFSRECQNKDLVKIYKYSDQYGRVSLQLLTQSKAGYEKVAIILSPEDLKLLVKALGDSQKVFE
jgi:hypothetical protein